jgi:hypothetical protein
MINLDANNARERFRRSPIGTWYSYLGGGADMLIGIRLTFHPDGTGTMEEWGFDHHHLNPAYVVEPRFQWRTLGERRIEITHQGETRVVSYDFKNDENEYKVKELRMFEPGKEPGAHGDVGFWVSPFSLVYREQAQQDKKLRRIMGRICLFLFVLLVVAGAWLHLFAGTPLSGPKLEIKDAAVASIELSWMGTKRTIRASNQCARVIQTLRKARQNPIALTPAFGTMTLYYADGTTNRFFLQPSGRFSSLEISGESGGYAISTGEILRTFADVGLLATNVK